MRKNTITILAIVLFGLLSATTGRAQVPVTRQKLWRCVLDLGTHQKIYRAAGFQHTVNEVQEAELTEKKRPNSDQCPVYFVWQEVPAGQESLTEGTVTAAPVTYFRSTSTVRTTPRGKDTRTGGQMVEETKRFMPEFGGSCKAFTKAYPGDVKPMWDALILEAQLDHYPANMNLPVKERLANILRDTATTRARIKTESSGCPYSVSKTLAMGLTQLEPSSVQSHCPNMDLSNPYVQISCGVAEALNKSNRYGGVAINAQIAYVAGPGKLLKYQAASGSTDPQVVLVWLEKGGKYPGQTAKGQPGKDYSDIAAYVKKNITRLPTLYVQNHEWFNSLLQLPQFRFLWKDLKGNLPEFGLTK